MSCTRHKKVAFKRAVWGMFKQLYPELMGEGDSEANWTDTELYQQITLYLSSDQVVDYSAESKIVGKPAMVSEKTNPLEFWKAYKGECWMLKYLARAVLSVPASAIACERIWSAAGRTFTKVRGGGGKQVVLHEIQKASEKSVVLNELFNAASAAKKIQ